MEIAAGTRIEVGGHGYLIEDRLGAGSQGQVYRGRDEGGEVVALKFITDPRRRHREADILAGWSSEHVVGLRDHGEWQKSEVLVMDLVDGLTLQRLQEICARLERGLHPALALELIAQVGRGLEEGYRTLRLKVHRDVKPSNVMLGRDGRGKILDFGIAYGVDLTVTGTPVATPLYMAPEQMEGARPAEELDHRTDQYSLGLLLAELVLGKPLRPMERDALARWLFVPGAELDAARERIGRQAPEVVKPLQKMLCWDPDGRFPSMGEAVAAMEAARAACAAPEPLEAFAERLMRLRDAGQLPDRSDPCLCPLVTAPAATSTTVLPDITGEVPKMPRPRHASPASERTGPVNLHDIKLLGTAPEGLRGQPVVAQVVRATPVGPLAYEADDPPTVATLEWMATQRRRTWAGLGAAALVIGLGVWAVGGGSTAAPAVAPADEASAAVEAAPGEAAPPAAVRVLRGDPKTSAAIPPVSRAGRLRPADAPAEVSAPAPRASAPPPTTEWRRTVHVAALGGDNPEALPAPIIGADRPGEDLVDPPAEAPRELLVVPEAEDILAADVRVKPPAVTRDALQVDQTAWAAAQRPPAEASAPAQAPSVSAPAAPVGPLMRRPAGVSDRKWCRQLLALGLAARADGQEDRAMVYFGAAKEADPAWDVVDQVILGDLERLPPEPPPAEAASSAE